MDIKINETNVRNVIEKLRGAVGAEYLPTAKAYEVVAQGLGFKNWDTLSGVLKKKSKAKKPASPALPHLGKGVWLYMQCSALDEYGTSPDYAKVWLTPALMRDVLKYRDMCEQHDLSEIRAYYCPHWCGDDPDLEEEFRTEGDELVVAKRDMWFTARPKHADYYIETRGLFLPELLKTLETGEDAETWGLFWQDGNLYHAADGDLPGFLETIEDSDANASDAEDDGADA